MQLTALAELAKQTNLPMSTLRRALASGGARLNSTALLSQTTRTNTDTGSETQDAVTAPIQEEHEPADASRPITGQIVTIAQDTVQSTASSQPMGMGTQVGEGSPDKTANDHRDSQS